MKFFKNIVAIVALFAIGSALGKATASRGGAKPTAQRGNAAPEMAKPSAAKTYSMLLAEIKKMRPADVVDNAGNLNQKFIDKILENQLSPIETGALLQAGINMHATWTADNQKNKMKLSKLTQQIAQSSIEELPEMIETVPNIRTRKITEMPEEVETVPAMRTRKITELPEMIETVPSLSTKKITKKALDQNYIENIADNVVRAKGFGVKGESPKMKKNRLVGLVKYEIINDMKSEWDQNKLEDLKTLVNKTLDQQIQNIVQKTLAEQGRAVVIVK